MHKVLVVDDEPIARASLTYLIDWEEHGFTIAAEAGNGQQALDLARREYFSLIVTDVRMPVMDGLSFIAKLREFSDTPVIILSGYEDFEYARQGLKMGVQDYLLKPVDDTDLIEVLHRMSRQLEQLDLARKQMNRGLSALQERFLRKWTSGVFKSRSQFEEQRRLVEWPETDSGYACMLAELDMLSGEETSWSAEEMELRRFSARNIIEEVCGETGYVFEQSEDGFGIVCLLPELMDSEVFLLEQAQRIVQSVLRYGRQSISVGIGGAATSYDRLPQSMSEARRALDGKFLSGGGAVLTVHSFASGLSDKDEVSLSDEELLEAVRTYRKDRIAEMLGRMWDDFRLKQVPEARVKTIVLDILIQLFRLLKEAGADENSVFDHKFGDYGRVMQARTIDELLRLMESKCVDVVDLLLRLREVQPNHSIEEVKSWVAGHYSGSISLRGIAARLYMNPVYLGQLFKTHTDMTFNEYLLKVRMDKAVELLLHTDKKVYEIASEVGYKQLDWFYKRFKAYTGISASEYRSSIKG